MASSAALRRVVQRRPLASSTAGGVSGMLMYGYAKERRADWEEMHRPQSAVLLPREYDSDQLDAYWSQRPFALMRRLATVATEMTPLVACYVKDYYLVPMIENNNSERVELLRKHAIRLREVLTNLGPAYVKGGQQLSIRPDLVSPLVLKELQLLCDSVRPVPDDVAMEVLKRELQVDHLEEIFEDMHLVASASLGQVYKAKLVETGQNVAVKIQRPGMLKTFSMDLFLLKKLGIVMDVFMSLFTRQAPYHLELFNSFARGSYLELDYENEARNQTKFKRELYDRRCKVHIPEVYFATRRVLASEWIDGVKLADSSRERIRELIPVGVELFLTQLLDIGAFHADPHPGNLLVRPDGTLCLLDFGLTAEVDEASRTAMTRALVHLLTRDFDSLVSQSAKELGFLPRDFDTSELKPILTKIITGGVLESGSDLRRRKRKLMEISNELNEVFFRYPFSVPPFFALVTRGLGLLEGIALTGDPQFDIFRASVPFARRRAASILGNRVGLAAFMNRLTNRSRA